MARCEADPNFSLLPVHLKRRRFLEEKLSVVRSHQARSSGFGDFKHGEREELERYILKELGYPITNYQYLAVVGGHLVNINEKGGGSV